jgi:hypothetical protein
MMDPVFGVTYMASCRTLGIAAAVIAVVGSIDMDRVVAGEPQSQRPAARRAGATLLPPRAALFYEYVMRPRDEPFKWQRIPWLVDLPEAVRQAKAEDRPILLWVAGNSPLQRC